MAQKQHDGWQLGASSRARPAARRLEPFNRKHLTNPYHTL